MKEIFKATGVIFGWVIMAVTGVWLLTYVGKSVCKWYTSRREPCVIDQE